MVKRVLERALFVENVSFKETRFLKPPKVTYAVYLDSYTSRGADYKNLIKEHTYTVELYASQADPNAEARIEDALDYFGLEYEKQERFWLQEEQLYQTIYTFDYIEK